jgi:hypothetical protein
MLGPATVTLIVLACCAALVLAAGFLLLEQRRKARWQRYDDLRLQRRLDTR